MRRATKPDDIARSSLPGTEEAPTPSLPSSLHSFDDESLHPLIPDSSEHRNESIEQIQDADGVSDVALRGMTRDQAWSLYISHFLSTWNARLYEFAAIIFTASVWPESLTGSAVRGIITQIASICFCSSIGRWIDYSPNRLTILLATISANRVSVILASVFWFLIAELASSSARSSHFWKLVGFAAVIFLGIVEKLSGVGNMMAMERDWVVAVAESDGLPYDLTHLNSVMRRIDLACKLFAPLVISVLVSVTGVKVGVCCVASMSVLSWGVECWAARRVWKGNERLRGLKTRAYDDTQNTQCSDDGLPTACFHKNHPYLKMVAQGLRSYAADFRRYFTTDVWVPSLALCLLHLSVLAYSATFITYLLNIGVSLNIITIARTFGSIVEISSTLVTPIGVRRLSKAKSNVPRNLIQFEETATDDDDEEESMVESEAVTAATETGLARLGLWGITWQLINLVPIVLCLWTLNLSPERAVPPKNPERSLLSRLSSSSASVNTKPYALAVVFTFLSFSRLGLWIFDLTTQQLTQTLVPPSQRSSFAGVEYSFVAFCELGKDVAAVLLSGPENFKYLAVGSWAAVAMATGMYVCWVWRRRGHLVHWERLVEGCVCDKARK